MRNTLDELQGEVQQLVTTIEHTAKEIDHLKDGIASFKQNLEEGRGGLIHLAREFSTNINHLAQEVHEHRSVLDHAAAELRHAIAEACRKMDDTTHGCQAALTSTISDFQSLARGAQQGATDLQHTATRLQTEAEHSHDTFSQLNQHIENEEHGGSHRIDEVAVQATHSYQQAKGFARQWAFEVQNQQQNLASMNEALVAKSTGEVTRIIDQMNALAANNVEHTVQAHQRRFEEEIRSALTPILQDLLAMVDRLFRDIEDKLRSLSDGTKSKHASLALVRKNLESVQAPVNAVLDQVRGIANTIGFNP